MPALSDFLLFTFISSIEYAAIIMFVFALFRIRFRWYDPKLLFMYVSMSYVSLTLRLYDYYAFYASLSQLLLLFVLMWLLLQFHIFYAAIMAVAGYVAFALLQSAIVFVSNASGMLALDALTLLSAQSYTVSLLTGTALGVIGYAIRRGNKGFAFVPHSDAVKVDYSRRQNWLLVLSIAAALAIAAVAYHLLFPLRAAEPVYFAVILLVAANVSLLLLFGYKDAKEADMCD